MAERKREKLLEGQEQDPRKTTRKREKRTPSIMPKSYKEIPVLGKS